MTEPAEGVTVVTGAASGMGLACAQRLARAGSAMVLVDRAAYIAGTDVLVDGGVVPTLRRAFAARPRGG